MKKISLIFSSIVFLFVIGLIIANYKPTGKLKQIKEFTPASAVLSKHPTYPAFLELKGKLSKPVNPNDSFAE